ncbi:MAG: DUF1934 domain-containing protein [Ruminococcaceae bacterium]|nr:DUF1934 domain-containing protein [Oscillospiraceae bacterium]
MTEKRVRVKIYSRITDISAIHATEKILGEEAAIDAAEDDIIEYSTDGVITERGDTVELSYEESVDMGMENTRTALVFKKQEPNTLTMARTGENSAGLIFSDTEKRQPCSYNVGGYAFNFCIYTRRIENKITLEGGTLNLDYVIEVQGVKTQRNRFEIKVDEMRVY